MILFLTNILFSHMLFGYSLFPGVDTQWKETDKKECAATLNELEKKFFSIKSYSYSVVYESYKDYTSTNVYSEQNGFIKRNGSSWCYSLMDRQVVQDSKYKVSIDAKGKTMQLSEPLKSIDEVDMQNFTTPSLWTNCKKTMAFSTKSFSGIRIELEETEGVVAKECYYNETQVLKMIYYYKTTRAIRKNNETITEVFYPRMEVSIKNFKMDAKFGSNELSTKTYIQVKGNKVIPSAKYESYKLIDARLKTN